MYIQPYTLSSKNKLKRMLFISFLVLLFIPFVGFAQIPTSPDLTNIGQQIKDKFSQPPVKVTGGFGINSIFSDNTGNGVPSSQLFTWMATGNLNFNIYGYNLPFTFTYSNQKVQQTYPSLSFNRFALHPKYKAWTAHIGDVYGNLSPYTLSGMQYTGFGLEYNKTTFHAEALYGRFAKAVKEDSTITPSYQRMGMGFKTVYDNKDKKLGIAVFHAQDNQNSIPAPILLSNSQIRPMAGTAISIEAAYPIIKKMKLSVEYSVSVLTKDLNSNPDSAQSKTDFVKQLAGTSNASTVIYHALKSTIGYTAGSSNIGVTYEKVDPGYQTLGGYYFTNDFENIAANLSESLFKGKVNISINSGFQHDDLAHTKQSSMTRTVNAINLNIRPSNSLTIGATYSNFQSYTVLQSGFEQINQVSPYQTLDTLNFTQLSQNIGLNLNYNLPKTKSITQAFSLTANFMTAANKKGDIIQLGDATHFLNSAINYTIGFADLGMNLAGGFNYSSNYAALTTSTILGPMINVTKVFFKKVVRTNLGISYNTSSSMGQTINIFNIRSGFTATLYKKHNLNMGITLQNKTANTAINSTYFTATAGYVYSF